MQLLDLGLLIVDEEQRFEWSISERSETIEIASGRADAHQTPNSKNAAYVDAWGTDLSVIENATSQPLSGSKLSRWNKNPMTIRDGIEREMARGVNVFYLYNRVETIGEEKPPTNWERLFQDVVGVIHGQMSETTLVKYLFQFIRKGNTMC